MNHQFSRSLRLLTLLFVFSLPWLKPSNARPKAGGSLITNGDFEEPAVAANTYKPYSAGQTFDGWTVSAGSVDHISATYWQVNNGGQSLDLNSCTPGTVYQDIPAEAGRRYLLQFTLSGNAMGAPAIKQMELWWGAQKNDTFTFDVTGTSKTNMGWKVHQVEIFNTEATPRLSFKSLTNGCFGPVIDAVSLTEAPQIFLPAIYANFFTPVQPD